MNDLPCFAVDIDNVLARAEGAVQRLYTDLTGEPWPASLFASAGGLDGSHMDHELTERIFSRFHEESIPVLPMMPGARFALQHLHRCYRIVLVTARRPTSWSQTLTWVQAHGLPCDALYHAEEKGEISERIVLAVDDHPVHARGYCEKGIRVFLMDQPWNRSFVHPLATRVNGWDELLQRLHCGSVADRFTRRFESSSPHSLLRLSFPIERSLAMEKL